MVLTKEQILETLKTRFADDTSDETLKFIEDITDTVDSYSQEESWKNKYEQNDAEWRRKYKERFFNPVPKEEEEEEPKEEPLTFDALLEKL